MKIRTLNWLLNFTIFFSAGLFIPLDLLPQAIQNILNVLPFKYLIYIPTKIYLGSYTTDLSGGLMSSVYFPIIIQLVWCVVLFSIASFVWTLAKKKFSGVGS